MKVAKITPELAAHLRGKTPAGCCMMYNPVKDADGHDVMSLAMAEYLNSEQYDVIDFKPVEAEEK